MRTRIEREYLNRNAFEGDLIEVKHVPFRSDGGEVYVVISTESYTGNCVKARNIRTREVDYIHDDSYLVFVETEYELVGVEVVEKKFLGITYKKEEIESWRGV